MLSQSKATNFYKIVFYTNFHDLKKHRIILGSLTGKVSSQLLFYYYATDNQAGANKQKLIRLDTNKCL